MSPRPFRLGVVLTHPTQYYSPWFRDVQATLGIELRVFYLWDFGTKARRDPQFGTSFQWDVDLLSGYESEFLPNIARDPGTHHFRGIDNPGLIRRLDAWGPDALLFFGYNWLTHLRAISWARLRRVPLLFRGDSHLLGRGRPSPVRRWLLRALYAQFRAFLHVGAANRDYFTCLGVPERKLHFAPHSVDSRLFDPDSELNRLAAADLRSELGIASESRVVLFAGKLVPAKQPRELLQAFRKVARTGDVLVYVGDGSEKQALLDAAATVPPGQIHFVPFTNQSRMPGIYLLADMFVLPSRGFYETWGLAVNEAMHMGVPALVSDLVGCQRDLVEGGVTGWVSRANDPVSLPQTLKAALEAVRNSAERERLRRAARERVSHYTYRETTAGLARALAALQSSPPSTR